MPGGSIPSTASESNVSLELVTTGDDNWTASAGNEVFNLTVYNTNSTLAIDEINITVPTQGDGNATFAVKVSTISFSNPLWNCTNATMDGVGNTSVLRCNTSTGNELVNGYAIFILFNATAPVTSSEDVHQWNVAVFNVTAVSVSQNISSGVDGMAPMFSDFGTNETYFNDDILLWVKITDPTLDTTAVNVTVINVSNTTQLMADPTGESCQSLTYDSWNCSVVWSCSTEGNYTFNVSAGDKGGYSNASTYYPSWFFYETTIPLIQFVDNTTAAGNYSQNDMEANVTANDTYLDTITVYLYNSTGLFNSTSSSSSPYKVNFANLPDEKYYLNASASDLAGNVNSTETRIIQLDVTAPTISILYPENKTYNSSTNVKLNYSVDDKFLHECWYNINGGSNTSLTNCANMTLPAFSMGFKNITVYANDTSGNLTAATRYFTIDLSVPNVTLNVPTDKAWDEDGSVSLNFTAVDALSSISNCSLWITDENGQNWHLNQSNSSDVIENQSYAFSASLTNSTNENGTYQWLVQCWDSVDKTANSSINNLYIGDRPNIMIQDIDWDKDPSPYPGINTTLTITVKNNGTANVVNTTWLEMCFGTGSNPCTTGLLVKNTTVPISAGSLNPPGSQQSIDYEVPINQSHGKYYIRARADFNNSEKFELYDELSPAGVNDNIYTEYFSTNLNVTIVKVTHYNNIIGPKPGANVTVNATVTYNNGTMVPGLVLANFTIEDRWMNESGRNYADKSSDLYVHDFSQSSSGIYEFNFSVPDLVRSADKSYAEYGLHYIKIGAEENFTGNHHTGESEEDVSEYYVFAPYLSISNMNSFDLSHGSTVKKTYTFRNDGNDNFTQNINLSDVSVHGGLAVSFQSYVDDENMRVGGSEGVMVTYTGSNIGNYTFKMNTTTIHDGKGYWYAKAVSVEVQNMSDGGNGDNGDNGNGGIQPPAPCVTNASCTSSQWCNNGVCTTLSCPSGFYASSHICKIRSVYEVDIKKYPKALYILQGETMDTNISVENTGNQNVTMMLEVDMDVEGVNFSVTPSSTELNIGERKNFSVDCNVSESTAIGNHSGKFKVTTSSTAKDTVSFTLVVQPLAGTIEEIKAEYDNYTQMVEQLIAEFESIKLSGFLSGQNLTMLEAKVNATRRLYDNAKAAMDGEDYAELSTLLAEMKTLVNQTRTLMDELGVAGQLGTEFWNTVIMWLVIGIVCIGAVGLLIYMLVPAQGYALGKGYSPAGKAAIVDKLKNTLFCLKAKFTGRTGGQSAGAVVKRCGPAYSEGYKKISAGYKPGAESGGGIAEKLKKITKIFKRG
jgi:hypothetical protein